MHIVVLGTGIVGTCSAAWLQRDGHRITFVSPVPAGEACSFGNAGSLSPSACLPVGLPGMWKQVPGWLRDPDGPLRIHPDYFLRVLPWLLWQIGKSGSRELFTLSVVAIIYTSLVALMQEDMKKLIAYSSVAHMGFVTMGIFAGNDTGVQGAVFQMLSHGLISGALFLCVGVVYDRMHTREIAFYGGLTARMPWYAAIFLMFTMANVGLPGTSGFVGEFLTFMAVFQVNTWVALVAATGVVFSAGYALWLYRRVAFGELVKDSLKGISDMDRREKLLFAPLVAMTLLLGVYPALVTDLIGPSTEALVTHYNAALGIDASSGPVTQAAAAPAAHSH